MKTNEYEIGFVQFYWGGATEIIGPFPDRDSAHEECTRRNKALGVTVPGRGKWGWMVAYWGEIPRAHGSTIHDPAKMDRITVKEAVKLLGDDGKRILHETQSKAAPNN